RKRPLRTSKMPALWLVQAAKESKDDSNHDKKEVAKSPFAPGAHQGSPSIDARAIRGRACPQLHRSESWLQPGTCPAGGVAMFGMRQAHLHRCLSRRRKGKGIRRTHCDR